MEQTIGKNVVVVVGQVVNLHIVIPIPQRNNQLVQQQEPDKEPVVHVKK